MASPFQIPDLRRLVIASDTDFPMAPHLRGDVDYFRSVHDRLTASVRELMLASQKDTRRPAVDFARALYLAPMLMDVRAVLAGVAQEGKGYLDAMDTALYVLKDDSDRFSRAALRGWHGGFGEMPPFRGEIEAMERAVGAKHSAWVWAESVGPGEDRMRDGQRTWRRQHTTAFVEACRAAGVPDRERGLMHALRQIATINEILRKATNQVTTAALNNDIGARYEGWERAHKALPLAINAFYFGNRWRGQVTAAFNRTYGAGIENERERDALVATRHDVLAAVVFLKNVHGVGVVPVRDRLRLDLLRLVRSAAVGNEQSWGEAVFRLQLAVADAPERFTEPAIATYGSAEARAFAEELATELDQGRDDAALLQEIGRTEVLSRFGGHLLVTKTGPAAVFNSIDLVAAKTSGYEPVICHALDLSLDSGYISFMPGKFGHAFRAGEVLTAVDEMATMVDLGRLPDALTAEGVPADWWNYTYAAFPPEAAPIAANVKEAIEERNHLRLKLHLPKLLEAATIEMSPHRLPDRKEDRKFAIREHFDRNTALDDVRFHVLFDKSAGDHIFVLGSTTKPGPVGPARVIRFTVKQDPRGGPEVKSRVTTMKMTDLRSRIALDDLIDVCAVPRETAEAAIRTVSGKWWQNAPEVVSQVIAATAGVERESTRPLEA